MSELSQPLFLKFLEDGVTKGGFETDDVLAALLPLMKQVQAAHAGGFVAPLNGLADLSVAESGQLRFAPDKVHPPEKNPNKVEALQASASRAVEVVAESRRVADIDQSSLSVSDLGVGETGGDITKPVFLPNYRSWENAVGHHDELTDIFSLGLLLASTACGLDFSDPGELELFTVNRTNLFVVHRRLNPVVASTIVHMTELNRHQRAQDLGQMICRLENYREQTVDFDRSVFEKKEFQESPVAGKRRLIQSHLRDRLFEISRRNRLIYSR